MKKKLLKLTVLLSFLFFAISASTQDSWTQKTSLPLAGRDCAASFSIGSKGYLLTGGSNVNPYLNDLWEFDAITNVWTQKAPLPVAAARSRASGFTIGSKGYIVAGSNFSGYLNDLWEYDPALNIWTQKTSLPATARFAGTAFSIGTKGYYTTGSNGAQYFNDLWEYDPSLNTWIQKASLPIARHGARSFTIGSKAYVTTGYNGVYLNDLWEYDPSSNVWLQKTSLPVAAARGYGVCFSLKNRGYLATGLQNTYLNDVWEFDPIINTWAQKVSLPASVRLDAVSFSLNDKGFIATGYSGISLNDLWEYTPCFDITNNTISTTQTDYCSSANAIDLIGSTPTSGNGSIIYQWQQSSDNTNFTNIDGATAQNYTSGSINQTTYFRRLVISGCTFISNNITITINIPVAPTISISTTTPTICGNSDVHFTADVTNQGASPFYEWKINGVVVDAGSQNSTDITNLHNGDVITCTLTSSLSCVTQNPVTSNSIIMTVNNPVTPTISISTTTPTICGNPDVHFTATVTNQGISPFYEWKVNDVVVDAGSQNSTDITNLHNGDVITCTLTSSLGCVTQNPVTSNSIIMTVNNTPIPIITGGNIAIAEGNGGISNATFTLYLSSTYCQPVTVDYTTSDSSATAGQDYTMVSGTVTFPANTTSRTISIPIIGDLLDENNELFKLKLSNPINATIGLNLITCTIKDDDPEPTGSINDVTVYENAGQALLTVSLSSASSKPVRVKYKTINGTAVQPLDYVRINNGDVTIPAGSTSTVIAVTINNNIAVEPTEYFDVEISNLQNATIGDGVGRVTILNENAVLTKSNQSIHSEPEKEEYESLFDVIVLGNPSNTGFTLTAKTSSNEKMKARVLDAVGHLIEVKENLQPGQIFRLGDRYINGVYFAEITQGRNRKVVKLVKQ